MLIKKIKKSLCGFFKLGSSGKKSQRRDGSFFCIFYGRLWFIIRTPNQKRNSGKNKYII